MHLVLMPGMDGTGILFEPLIEALPEGWTASVVAYDGAEPLGYAALEEVVAAALPAEGPFVLLGESFSGPLALRVACRRPPGLRAVVLCATFLTSPHALLSPRLAPLVPDALFVLFPRFVRLKALAGGYASPRLRALFDRVHPAVAARVLAARVREILAVDASELLRACPVPVLYLRGTRDGVVPARNVAAVRRARPSVEVAEVDAPHLVLQVAPAEALAHVQRFLARLPA